MSGIKGYVISTELGGRSQQEVFRRLIWKAAYELVDKPDRDEIADARQGRRCSFCPRRSSEVEITVGLYAAICKICATTIVKHFNDPPAPEGGSPPG